MSFKYFHVNRLLHNIFLLLQSLPTTMLFLELFVYTCSLRKSDDLLFIPHHPLGVMVNIYIMGDYYQTEVQIWIIIIMFGHTM